ncbi:MAG TPA: PP2C family protein-serine/threonine phosphatase, partial [Acidimicrobiales bacterium]|nr:PP2C family protein-serine/threonine phosphatase [Acidimicrobiales bacterium]
VGGLDVAGFYAPADDISQVGGDWFDAIPLRDGSVALIIGDMAGHDLHAATRMGAVRHKLRAIAGDRMAPPAEILERLDALLAQLAPDDIATAVYGRLIGAADGWSFEWSQAGHLPPLLVHPDGRSEYLEGPADAPLGATETSRRSTRREHLRDGSTIVLYTDGLVERAGEGIDDGLTRLLTASRLVHGLAPAEACAALVEQVDPARGDDIAILAARLPDG